MRMRATFKSLPEDPTELRAVSALMAAEIKTQAYQIEKLKKELAGHRKARFGSKSETMDQLAFVRKHPPKAVDGERLVAQTAFGFRGFGAHFFARRSKLSRMRPMSASSGSNFPPCHSSIWSCSACFGSAMTSTKLA